MKPTVDIQPSWANTIEHKCCSLAGFKCQISEDLRPDTIGIGSVEYCRSIHHWPACDPYPDWLPWGRQIYRDIAPKVPLFYKPADIPKRFESRVMDIAPLGKWVASDPVSFVTEWRAYVVKGLVLTVLCYSDFDNNAQQAFPAWHIPDNVTATIDFGLTLDGQMLPVEVNDPYAIGWYGALQDGGCYAKFIKAGWETMTARLEA